MSHPPSQLSVPKDASACVVLLIDATNLTSSETTFDPSCRHFSSALHNVCMSLISVTLHPCAPSRARAGVMINKKNSTHGCVNDHVQEYRSRKKCCSVASRDHKKGNPSREARFDPRIEYRPPGEFSKPETIAPWSVSVQMHAASAM